MAEPPYPEIPPEPELPYRLWWGGFEHHATALGYICLTYANLEGSINRHIEFAVPCSTDKRRAIVQASGTSIDNRCNLIITLAAIEHPSKEWFEDVETLLKRVKSELAPERNRLIHDQWIASETLMQWDERAFVNRPQSHQPKRIVPRKEIQRELSAIWDLVRRIQEVDCWLSMLFGVYGYWRSTGKIAKYPRPPDEVRKGIGQG